MIVRADEVAPQPWRNGNGLTRELRADAPAWRWRVSLADIAADGPFSAYPGVQRWFAVVDGAGVELQFACGARTLRCGDAPLAFDGAAAPACRLLAGATRDLNLMLRGGARGTMQRAVPGQPWAEDWPLRGRFDPVGMELHWGLPTGPLTADGESLWIGVAP
ncbi:MAG: hypothetical protein ABT20_14530 [Rubrivivax sp. SCN 70-15]|nr:MAG: hypothetical protein ABT20_14530 [Rubrivivax sp. SCN 70-15]